MTSSEPHEIQEFLQRFKSVTENLARAPLGLASNPQLNNETPPQVNGERIQHDYIELLGDTTNILVFSYFDNNQEKKFTRENIRMAIDSHKRWLRDYLPDRDISRIQSGKAAVDYWIDRLVENEEIEKQNSNPVKFWRRSSTLKKKVKASSSPFYGILQNNQYEMRP